MQPSPLTTFGDGKASIIHIARPKFQRNFHRMSAAVPLQAFCTSRLVTQENDALTPLPFFISQPFVNRRPRTPQVQGCRRGATIRIDRTAFASCHGMNDCAILVLAPHRKEFGSRSRPWMCLGIGSLPGGSEGCHLVSSDQCPDRTAEAGSESRRC